MGVAVPVGGREAEGTEVGELGADCGFQGGMGPAVEEIAETGPRRSLGAEGEMQANTELRVAAGDRDGLSDVRFVDHETRLSYEPGAVQVLDGSVHRGASTEIIGSEDEGFQSTKMGRRKGA